MNDEPLLLAACYSPDREPDDIFLFEVSEDFGTGSVDADREIFEVTYDSTSGFPMEAGQRLHLVLTNPCEFETAIHEKWPALAELRDAISAGSYRIVYRVSGYARLPEMLNA
jgi:hypothetical protein